MSSNNILPIAVLGLGAYFLAKNVKADTSSAFFPSSSPINITVPGVRVDGIAHKDDVGSTKILPIVSTNKTITSRDRYMKKDAKVEDVIRYNTSKTAIEKIKSAVKVLPKKRADELQSNLDKLGW